MSNEKISKICDDDETNNNSNIIQNINNNSPPAILLTEPKLNFKNLTKQDILHINYGEVSFKVEEINDSFIRCIALNSGLIQKNDSLSVEGKEHFINDLIINDKEKLKQELVSAINLEVEYIVISIIETPVKEIK